MSFPPELILTTSNGDCFPAFKEMFEDGRIVADSTGRLRYPHGASVGRMILIHINKDGTPRYRESADEWFDTESPQAQFLRGPIDAGGNVK
ncbi:MAG TPA: hypothetical protein DD473_06520 [Planctomycetaceae bacterium]|nr:hypothetical protein [Planctomycetaceae bacterium]|tara:strand:- start:765 stop:1037 length:273 start_codon:yes stop_codon:yes gene_type:complete